MDESSAIDLCIRHRDPVGFEFLVRKYRREAYMHAVALLGNRDDAADACQDSFASAFATLPRLEALTAFYPWFYRILRNRCLNVIGRRKTRNEFARRFMEEGHDTASTPEALLIAQQESKRTWDVLMSLKPEFREILALKYFHDQDYESLAMLIGISRGTVMSRLYYARKAFQAALLQGGETHE